LTVDIDNTAPEQSLPESSYNRVWAFVQRREFGLIAALLSLAALVFYVFFCTPYQEFVFSDMEHYWSSALERLDGNAFDETQFVAWPPLYHIILAELFRVLHWLGLGSLVRLETALVINMLAFSASVYTLQRVAAQWFVRPEFIVLTVVLYAFGFPALYFNAFLLSENLGMPLMVIAFALVVHKQTWWAALLAGLLFALAAIIRPAFGPYGLAFVLFYLAYYRISWRFIRRAALFSAVFFSVVLLASAEVARISQGKVFGLSANGGLDFFINTSNYYRIDTRYDGWHFVVVAPALSWEPENGTFDTDVPFYNQDYYFQQGWQFLQRDPWRLWRGFQHMGHLFFAEMLPSQTNAPGFLFWRPVWDWFKFGMFLALGMYLRIWRKLGERLPEFVLMISVVILTLIVSFIFTGEPRYMFFIIFIFYLLFFKLVEIFWQHGWRHWLRPLSIYVALLIVVSSAAAAVIEIRRWDLGPPNTRLSLLPDGIINPLDPSIPVVPVEVDIRRVRFPYREDKIGLFHGSKDHPPLEQAVPVRIHTRMEVLGTESIAMRFENYSAWPFRLYIDQQEIIFSDSMDYFEPVDTYMQMEPGVYDIEIIIDYYPLIGGFATAYNYREPDGWRIRRYLGVASDRVQFLLPEKISAAVEPGKQTP
jgi:hypothetical protein